jgi:hypothetical protein
MLLVSSAAASVRMRNFVIATFPPRRSYAVLLAPAVKKRARAAIIAYGSHARNRRLIRT